MDGLERVLPSVIGLLILLVTIIVSVVHGRMKIKDAEEKLRAQQESGKTKRRKVLVARYVAGLAKEFASVDGSEKVEGRHFKRAKEFYETHSTKIGHEPMPFHGLYRAVKHFANEKED